MNGKCGKKHENIRNKTLTLCTLALQILSWLQHLNIQKFTVRTTSTEIAMKIALLIFQNVGI